MLWCLDVQVELWFRICLYDIKIVHAIDTCTCMLVELISRVATDVDDCQCMNDAHASIRQVRYPGMSDL